MLNPTVCNFSRCLTNRFRMTDGSCQSRQHMVTTYGHSSGICCIMITEHDYPSLIAHQLLSKITDEFLTLHPPSSLSSLCSELIFPKLKTYLLQYHDPSQVDSVTKIQRELRTRRRSCCIRLLSVCLSGMLSWRIW